ncbi:MAG: hypothetical protein ABI999_15150 [Acidobacteriota bacterium]
MILLRAGINGKRFRDFDPGLSTADGHSGRRFKFLTENVTPVTYFVVYSSYGRRVPSYNVYIFCDQCGQPHSVHLTLELEDKGLNKRLVKDVFAGSELPSEIVYMQGNKYRCPHTNQFFTADNIDLAALFSANRSST